MHPLPSLWKDLRNKVSIVLRLVSVPLILVLLLSVLQVGWTRTEDISADRQVDSPPETSIVPGDFSSRQVLFFFFISLLILPAPCGFVSQERKELMTPFGDKILVECNSRRKSPQSQRQERPFAAQLIAVGCTRLVNPVLSLSFDL